MSKKQRKPMDVTIRGMSGNPARRAWEPMTKGALNPLVAQMPFAQREGIVSIEAWGNRLYQATAFTFESGWTHVSFKRQDRAAVRDWRHMQTIKNEVCGPDREAVELFPAESRLLDSANEFHLWVAPAGVQFPFGFQERSVIDDAEGQALGRMLSEGMGMPDKARQRAFEPGTGGPTDEDREATAQLMEAMRQLRQ